MVVVLSSSLETAHMYISQISVPRTQNYSKGERKFRMRYVLLTSCGSSFFPLLKKNRKGVCEAGKQAKLHLASFHLSKLSTRVSEVPPKLGKKRSASRTPTRLIGSVMLQEPALKFLAS